MPEDCNIPSRSHPHPIISLMLFAMATITLGIILSGHGTQLRENLSWIGIIWCFLSLLVLFTPFSKNDRGKKTKQETDN